jgi:hypothetical protein
LQFPIEDIVNPVLGLFEHKGNSIDIEQKQHLHSLFEFVKLFIVSRIFYNYKFIFSPLVAVNFLAFWTEIVLFLFFVFVKLFLFIEILSPTSKSNPILAFVCLQDFFDNFDILLAQFALLRLALLHQLDPVVEGGAQEVKDKL